MASWLCFLVILCELITTFLPLQYQVLALDTDRGQYEQGSCDHFQGRWVYDDSYPLYNSTTCPFIGQGFECQKNGRPDKDYLKFRWQPTGCDIPRFNGVDFLERYRNKKIMFVGDSLSNNMWVSLTCLLHAAVPNSTYTTNRKGLFSTFTLPEYRVSVIWLKDGFLVDVAYEAIGKVLKLDSISRGQQWLGMDMLIFNTYHWWFHKGRFQTWDYFRIGNEVVHDMDRFEALEIALTTWANWVDKNVDLSKTTVFFQGPAATHLNAKEWKPSNPHTKSCAGQTEPVLGSKYPGPSNTGEEIVKRVISNMERPAYLLDITLLTQLRKDGHPSTYAGSGSKLNDCSHWCLAGVPDTWNQLLYAATLK